MTHEILLCIYLAAWAAQIILLTLAMKRNNMLLWISLYGFEVICVAASLAVMHYYNENPGYMLSTMGHVLWSLGAAGIFLVMLLVSCICHVLKTGFGGDKKKRDG